MLTQTQEQILAFLLSHPEDKLTIRGIAKKLYKSYTLVYNNIDALEKKKIIKKQSIPPGQVITLNEFAPIHIFVDIEIRRKRELMQKYPWIQIMLEDILSFAKNPFFILLIFGSYAKGTQTIKSDLDLLIIVQDKKDIKEIEDAFHETYTKVKKAPNFVDINDFKEMLYNTNVLNIGNEAKKTHIIIYGVEEYYGLLKKIYKK